MPTIPAEVLVAILAFFGTLVGAVAGQRLTAYRILQLEKKVDKHNNVIERIYKLEEKACEANRRLQCLEEADK